LHVYSEVKEIDARVRSNAGKCDLLKLRELCREGSTEPLQMFINTAVEYAKSFSQTSEGKVSVIKRAAVVAP